MTAGLQSASARLPSAGCPAREAQQARRGLLFLPLQLPHSLLTAGSPGTRGTVQVSAAPS